jgi:hypothetical protein
MGFISGTVQLEGTESTVDHGGATVYAIDKDTGTVYTTTSNSDGTYRIDNVPSGDYAIAAFDTVDSQPHRSKLLPGVGPNIPDSVVSRPTDNNFGSLSGKFGVRINSNVEWPSIGAELSSNYAGASTAYIHRVSDGQLMGQTDISALSAGDVFTVNNVDLAANTDYNFVVDNGGSGYTNGNYDSPSLPYTSSDGDLSIINGANGEQGPSSSLNNLVRVGDVGLS